MQSGSGPSSNRAERRIATLSHANQFVSFFWIWLMFVPLGDELRSTLNIEDHSLAPHTDLTTENNLVAPTIIQRMTGHVPQLGSSLQHVELRAARFCRRLCVRSPPLNLRIL